MLRDISSEDTCRCISPLYACQVTFIPNAHILDDDVADNQSSNRCQSAWLDQIQETNALFSSSSLTSRSKFIEEIIFFLCTLRRFQRFVVEQFEALRVTRMRHLWRDRRLESETKNARGVIDARVTVYSKSLLEDLRPHDLLEPTMLFDITHSVDHAAESSCSVPFHELLNQITCDGIDHARGDAPMRSRRPR